MSGSQVFCHYYRLRENRERRDCIEGVYPNFERLFCVGKHDGWKEDGDPLYVFTAFEDYTKFIKYFDTTRSPYFFEINLNNKPFKFYLDVDIEDDNEEDAQMDFDNLMINLLDIVQTQWSVWSGVPVFDPHKDIIFYQSHGFSVKKQKYKRSLHAIFPTLIVENQTQAKCLYDSIIKDIFWTFREYIDRSVYKPYQLFRLVYNSKLGENRFKFPLQQWEFGPHSGTYEPSIFNPNTPDIPDVDYIDKNKLAINWLKRSVVEDSLITFVNRQRRVYPCRLKYQVEKIKKPLAHIELPEEFPDPPDGYDIDNVDIGGGIVTLHNNGTEMCPVCERVHENENAYIRWDPSNSIWWFTCHRATDMKLKIHTIVWKRVGKAIDSSHLLEI